MRRFCCSADCFAALARAGCSVSTCCASWHCCAIANPLSEQNVLLPCRKRAQCSFTGRERYRRHTWNQDAMQQYTTKVTSMQMLDNQSAQLQWAWKGQLANAALSADVTSTLTLNQLTGKILEHTDDISLHGNTAAQALYRLRKSLWATRQRFSALTGRVCLPASCI